MDKKIPKLIGVTNRPTIIVGEKPNKTRMPTIHALIGNLTGDFVEEAIEGKTNLILTNVVNVLYHGRFDNTYLGDGLLELLHLFETHQPKQVICLGGIAQKWVASIWRPSDCALVNLPHPSWVNRFRNKDRIDYVQALKNCIP